MYLCSPLSETDFSVISIPNHMQMLIILLRRCFIKQYDKTDWKMMFNRLPTWLHQFFFFLFFFFFFFRAAANTPYEDDNHPAFLVRRGSNKYFGIRKNKNKTTQPVEGI